MNNELLALIESQRAVELKSFLILFGVSVVLLTSIYLSKKSFVSMAFLLFILFNLANFYYFNTKYSTYAKQLIIPTLEKQLHATYHDKSYLTVEKLNALKTFHNQVTDIESFGYFEKDNEISEYLQIKFVKQDSEGNDLVRILFDGKVLITSEDKAMDECEKNEYFEAGEVLNAFTKSCKFYHDNQYYYVYHNEKLFREFHLFLTAKK
jgi:hypothetical protein